MKTKNYGLTISMGNSKMGPIPNWSLMAGETCPMHCKGCYAMKGNHRYENVQMCRIVNTDFITNCCINEDFTPFIDEMNDFLRSKDCIVNLFRIHESGDFFINKNLHWGIMYASAWYQIVKANPTIQFMAFTKAYDVLESIEFYNLPNINVMLSSWTGLNIPERLRKHYRVAWYRPKNGSEDFRIPENGFVCPGKKLTCIKCKYCWKTDTTRDTILNEH